ncbi:MAG: hypothetical protein AB1589_37610 [Cyanobacteriota bacterium]
MKRIEKISRIGDRTSLPSAYNYNNCLVRRFPNFAWNLNRVICLKAIAPRLLGNEKSDRLS